MKKIFFVAFVLLVSAFASLADTETRSVPSFKEISLRIGATVYYEQGDKQSVEITARPETLSKLIAEVKDDKLILRYSVEDRLFSSWEPGLVSIKIVSPEIEMLAISGSGDIICEKSINTNLIELNISGSGDIKIASLRSDQVKAVITGSGDIIFSGNGNAMNLDVNINGSGDVRADQFPVDYAKIWVAGSGDCNVTVNKHIEAKIVGSGDIRYRGNPTIDSSMAGSGTLRKMD